MLFQPSASRGRRHERVGQAKQALFSGTTALFLVTITQWIVPGRRVVDAERITLPIGIGMVAGIAAVAPLVRPSGANDASVLR